MKKNYFLFLLMFLAVGLVSCNDDKDEPAPLPEVVGKWIVDYGVVSGIPAGANVDGLQNGHKIDPYNELYWLGSFPINTVHILQDKNLFVNVFKYGALAETYPGTWTYTSPDLKLDYNDPGVPDENYKYSVVDGLPQIAITQEVPIDSTGNVRIKIDWIFHQ